MKNYLEKLRNGQELSLREQIGLIMSLSLPAILAQLSSIVMQYIDASMVGHLGSKQAAAIALVSSCTWFVGGIGVAVNTGFNVQVAHQVGAKNNKAASIVVRKGLVCGFVLGLILAVICAGLSSYIPQWMGAQEAIRSDAGKYFFIYGLFFPAQLVGWMAGGMLQCSGNMKVPSVLQIVKYVLDVIFNLFLIFEVLEFSIAGHLIRLKGAGLSVAGAALGTAFAELIVAGIMLYWLFCKTPSLRHQKDCEIADDTPVLKENIYLKALKIGIPVAVEQFIMCAAYIAMTRISAPLGTAAIAAHSFAITAESLVYMPGYGISQAAVTVIGQSIGAKRGKLTWRLGWLCTFLGMFIMTVTGAFMYAAAPFMIGILSPDETIRELGSSVLKIEAFAEPFYAAAIVTSGVFRGAGDTLMPSVISFISMWIFRIPIAAFLAPHYGLKGMWIAMCIELIIRGILMMIRLYMKSKK